MVVPPNTPAPASNTTRIATLELAGRPPAKIRPGNPLPWPIFVRIQKTDQCSTTATYKSAKATFTFSNNMEVSSHHSPSPNTTGDHQLPKNIAIFLESRSGVAGPVTMKLEVKLKVADSEVTISEIYLRLFEYAENASLNNPWPRFAAEVYSSSTIRISIY
ncbi:hypothetical protein UA08_02899 [Talaromyces atroroseus]|uniref:Uncharacterized protein n=1 Tax=Talaromyces atroroseus TaxID=1441469 RepID=A0A225B751_TALAT|nr:hypothetical protein UA08_02899 [Talaromyces atroroseus]OKL61747.1 hypothetical protein UA08_02899 [Talaromyces atroroseus]